MPGPSHNKYQHKIFQCRFLAHFYGDVGEIDLSHGGKPEFKEYTWLPIEQLPQEVVHFKREVYEQVAQEFSPRITRWLQEQEGRNRCNGAP